MIGYKYRSGRGPRSAEGESIFERDIDALSQDRIFVPTVSQLNDPSEGLINDLYFQLQLNEISHLVKDCSVDDVRKSLISFVEYIKNAGVYSLSSNPLSELMWAYYANGHNGYAIIFDTDVISESINGGRRFAGVYEFDIEYSDRFPSIDLSLFCKTEFCDFIKAFLGHKSKAWKHEKEHRLVFDKGGECKKIDYRAIKGFVFGALMPDSDIDYVMDKFKGRGLYYKKVELIRNTYGLRLADLEDEFTDAPHYRPNNVKYDFGALLEYDRCSFGDALHHKLEAKQALDIVSEEPFVTGIYLLLLVEDDANSNVLNITVGADYDNPSLVQIKKVFRFVVNENHEMFRTE